MIKRYGTVDPRFQEDVLIIDTNTDSSYFKVSDFPSELTAGKNMFKIYGDRHLLRVDKPILISVTDVNGNPIYHHNTTYIDSTGRVVISPYIYPDTPPGTGKVQILAIAKKRIKGNDIKGFWANKYNVLWSRDIAIDPIKVNTSPVLFKKIPGLKIVENVREYLTQTYGTGTAQHTASSDDIGGNTTYAYPGFGSAYIVVNSNTGVFSASMEGGLLTVPEPGVVIGAGNSFQPGETAEYTTVIHEVISSTQIRVSPYSMALQSQEQVGTEYPPSYVYTPYNYEPTAFTVDPPYEISYQQEATLNTGSLNSQSFASITLKNLTPVCGNIHNIKTYIRSHGFADFQLVGDNILVERDLLMIPNADLAFDRFGRFYSQETINNYWASESVNQSINFRNVYDNDVMISSLRITGSSGLTEEDAYIKTYCIPKIEVYKDNEYEIKFRAIAKKFDGQEVKSKMAVYISGSNIPNSDDRQIGEKIVQLSADGETQQNWTTTAIDSQGNAWAELQTTQPKGLMTSPTDTGWNNTYTSTFTQEYAASWPSNSTANVDVQFGVGDDKLLDLPFIPSKDDDIQIVFAVESGDWYINDVVLQGAIDYQFTPNHTFIEVPVDAPRQDDILDFRFEFYNAAGQQANISLLTESINFSGSNLFISGNNNVLSGSIIIGDGFVMEGFTVAENTLSDG